MVPSPDGRSSLVRRTWTATAPEGRTAPVLYGGGERACVERTGAGRRGVRGAGLRGALFGLVRVGGSDFLFCLWCCFCFAVFFAKLLVLVFYCNNCVIYRQHHCTISIQILI